MELKNNNKAMPITAKINCFLKMVNTPVLASDAEAILNKPITRTKIMAPIKTQSNFFNVRIIDKE